MTNYNERLDEILYRFIPATDYSDKRETDPTDQGRAKQAITSLIKELVAEAKPPYRDNTNSVVPLPEYDDTVSMVANQAIDNYEANLLKALEEV